MNDIAFAISDLINPAADDIGGRLIEYQSFHAGTKYQFPARIADVQADAENEQGVSIVMWLKQFKFARNRLDVMPQEKDTIVLLDEPNPLKRYYTVLEDSGARAVEPGDHQSINYVINCKNTPPPSDGAVYGNKDGVAYGNKDGVGYGSAVR